MLHERSIEVSNGARRSAPSDQQAGQSNTLSPIASWLNAPPPAFGTLATRAY